MQKSFRSITSLCTGRRKDRLFLYDEFEGTVWYEVSPCFLELDLEDLNLMVMRQVYSSRTDLTTHEPRRFGHLSHNPCKKSRVANFNVLVFGVLPPISCLIVL